MHARVVQEPFPASTALSPLKLLRNPQALKFEGVGEEEISYENQLDAKIVAQSDDPSPLSMHPSLLVYAQTFERSSILRDELRTVRWHCCANMNLKPAPSTFLPQKRRVRKFMNPLKTVVAHPVEHALELAKFACDENDIEEFKTQRKFVLEYRATVPTNRRFDRPTTCFCQQTQGSHRRAARNPECRRGIPIG